MTIKLTALISIILLVAIGPFLSIWALNTLFGLMIPFSLKTWAAMVIIHLLIAKGSK